VTENVGETGTNNGRGGGLVLVHETDATITESSSTPRKDLTIEKR